MEQVFEHLRLTVQDMIARQGGAPIEIARYVDDFHDDCRPDGQSLTFATGFPRRSVLRAAEWLLRDETFDVGKGADLGRGILAAHLKRDFGKKPDWLAVPSARRDWRFAVRVKITVAEDGTVTLVMTPAVASWMKHFRTTLADHLARTHHDDVESERAIEAARGGTPGEVVLEPGKPLAAPFRGSLRDYSGCAPEPAVADLLGGRGGVLPLGRYAFAHPDKDLALGAPLYLAPLSRTGARREHQGTLICAPQNAGKTEFLLRWARAANAAGYNLLLVDVKGNMLRKLKAGGGWKGELYHVTTDPLVMPGDAATPCHALNLLDGIDPRTAIGIERIRQLAEALLPADGLDRGETKVWRVNWLNWLTAFIHLVLLDHFYWPVEGRAPDLGDVYELASNENHLIACLRRIDEGEWRNIIDDREPLDPGLDAVFSDIAVLLPQTEIIAGDDWRPSLTGERSEHSYRWLTEHLVSVLRPFRRHGLLNAKVSGRADIPHVCLERLAGLDQNLAPASEQVTVVLAAREQELDEAKTLLTVAITKLQQALYERMRHTGDPKLRPVMLMLDETRRIRNFKTNEYVSFAREAEAGCVVVYQSLDQIGEPKQITELLENIGTQIYLGSLTGQTAKLFTESLRKRFRASYVLNAGGDAAGGIQIGQQEIPYFSSADLDVLPAGDFPALIYLRDQPRRQPILVTLDRAHNDAGK